MKVREVTQSILRHWPVGAMALVAALAFVLVGQGNNPLAAQTAIVASPVTTVIHYPNHTALPCFSFVCVANEHVGPAGTSVHDKAFVSSADVTKNPTGSVQFRFFTNLHCMGSPSSGQAVAVVAGGGVGTAESSPTAPLAAGDYSYKTVYFPDAAAKALGFGNTPGPCEQLRMIRVSSSTKVHYADHTELACFDVGCLGQTGAAPATIHDKATIDSTDAARTPTGTVRFAFYNGEHECRGIPTSIETVAVSGSGAITTAESSDIGPLPAGGYSYKAIYFPDAAAIALGLGSSPSPCEQILLTP